MARQSNILSELVHGGACTVIASHAADLILSCIAQSFLSMDNKDWQQHENREFAK